ncbi:hypothetical protein CPB83DRAFT_652004 [Crepidotus variabilis]|uniref:Uncharacterized protein n=1 Tax=Crepidotus variabilis TaxID=179855 RepID=A0A9P6JK48_9AGAR|nr:hypothetical protein CPB83DRAFT_652004 [Crepidotus variabilis]
MSPEELRVKAVEAVKRGNLEQYTRYEANQFAAAEKEYKKVRSNIPGAVHRAWERSELVLNSSTTPSTVGSGILSPSVLCGTKKQRWNAGPKVVVSPAWPWNRAGPEEVELETIKSTPVRVTAAVEGEVKQVSLSGPSSASVIRSKGKQPLRESSP